jgi:hypothetical protein
MARNLMLAAPLHFLLRSLSNDYRFQCRPSRLPSRTIVPLFSVTLWNAVVFDQLEFGAPQTDQEGH